MVKIFNRRLAGFTEHQASRSGTYGEISYIRLCELLERGEGLKADQHITELDIQSDRISYRIEPKPKETKRA